MDSPPCLSLHHHQDARAFSAARAARSDGPGPRTRAPAHSPPPGTWCRHKCNPPPPRRTSTTRHTPSRKRHHQLYRAHCHQHGDLLPLPSEPPDTQPRTILQTPTPRDPGSKGKSTQKESEPLLRQTLLGNSGSKGETQRRFREHPSTRASLLQSVCCFM